MEQHFGKYRVKQEIGRGAMGSVYLAFDTVLERDVAIKTISSSIRDENLKQRFIREARAAGKLLHNNIVTIYDFGVENERLFIAMEYLPGSDLYQVIAENRPMDVKDKLEIVRQICLGLDFAHKSDVFHRDIKPANVRLLEDGSIKIVDFGLAVMQTSSLTQSGAFLGTPNYVAPERLHGRSGDGRSDQFAVGIVLYELLTYAKAFTGENISTVMFSVLNDNPRSLDPALNSRYPELQEIILRSVAKNPEHRYHGMNHMAEDIGAVLEKMKTDEFSMTGPVPIIEPDHDATALRVHTDKIHTADLSTVPGGKKSSRGLFAGIAAVMVAAALLLYFLVLKPGSADPGEPPQTQTPPVAAEKQATDQVSTGFLAFHVLPYAVLESVVSVADGSEVAVNDDENARTSPLRLELPAGVYRLSYSHPLFKQKTRNKEITIESGKVTSVFDRLDNRFMDEAVKRFRITPPRRK